VLRPHRAAPAVGPADSANPLIQGDNLEALKPPLPFYRGLVKCSTRPRAPRHEAHWRVR
jgi:hypothetical protein